MRITLIGILFFLFAFQSKGQAFSPASVVNAGAGGKIGGVSYSYTIGQPMMPVLKANSGYLFSYAINQADKFGMKKAFEFSELSIRAFPNPTKDRLFIEVPDASNTKFEVYDVTGRPIDIRTLSFSRETSKIGLNLSGLPEGLYLVKITSLENNKSNSLSIIKH